MVLKVGLMAILNLDQMETIVHIEQSSVGIANVTRVDNAPIVIKRDVHLVEQLVIVWQEQQSVEHVKSLLVVCIPPRFDVRSYKQVIMRES